MHQSGVLLSHCIMHQTYRNPKNPISLLLISELNPVYYGFWDIIPQNVNQKKIDKMDEGWNGTAQNWHVSEKVAYPTLRIYCTFADILNTDWNRQNVNMYVLNIYTNFHNNRSIFSQHIKFIKRPWSFFCTRCIFYARCTNRYLQVNNSLSIWVGTTVIQGVLITLSVSRSGDLSKIKSANHRDKINWDSHQ